MAFVVKDRIKETTTTTGTGAYTLAGAANGGYQTFADIGNANTTYYACTDGTDWEVGRGTYTATGTTLSRDEIIESSNSNNAVNWGSGTKDIFVTLPSSKALVMDNNDEFNVNSGDAIRFGANQASHFPRMSLSINGSAGALGMSEPSVGTSTLTLTGQILKGVGDDGDLHFLGQTINEASRLRLYGGNTEVFTTNGDGSGVSITGALSVSGDLTVNGTTTTVNSTTVTIDDPVFTLGGDTAPASDDNKDRGIEFRWHNGSAAKLGFFGFDDSSGKFTFIPDATNTSEVFSGTAGTIVADIEGNLTGNSDTASAADFLTGLADPDADRLLMWDDSAGAHKFVTLGSNLSFSGTTLNATDTNTTYSTASASTLGLVKIGYTEHGKNYPVELDSEQMYVNVPWTDTTYSVATSSTAGLVEIGYTENGKNYPVELSSNKMYVNVPWTDTTYSAGDGLSLSGTTFTNTAPDQTVSLTGAGATSVSGTYPNFTITSTDTDTNTTYTAGTGLELSGTEFAINTTIVPRKGSSNTYEFNQEIEIPNQFAGYKQWSFVNTSGSDLAYLGFHGTNGNLQLRNLSSGDDVLITGHGGVELQINDGSVNNSGVRVFKLGTNVTGSIDWNGAARIQGNAVGANVVGNLSVTGTVDGVDIATRDGVLTTTTTTANAALPKAGGTMTGQLVIDHNTGSMLKLQATNSSPWAIELGRDDVTNSRVFNGGGYWAFEHNPRFYNSGTYNRLLHTGDEGSGNGLDADTVDGIQASSFLRSDTDDTATGDLTLNGWVYHDVAGQNFVLRSDTSNRNTLEWQQGTTRIWTLDLQADGDLNFVDAQGGNTLRVGNSRVFADNYHPNADKWTTARTLSLSGDASGSVSWDGSANATLSVTVSNDSHTHNKLIAIDDRDMKPNTSGIQSGNKAIRAFFSSKGGMTGTANTDYHDVLVLDTYSDSSGGGPNAISFDKGNSAGSPEAYLWKGAWGGTTWGTGQRIFADNYHPNADKWTTARTLSLSGDASGSVSWDGSANATLSVTVANNSHTHTNTTLDMHFGRQTQNIDTYDPDSYWATSKATGGQGSYPSDYVNVYNFAGNGSSEGTQLATYYGSNNRTWIRSRNDNTNGWLGWSEVWTSTTDGSGSGLDADLWDGNQFSDYLNQNVKTTASPTFGNLNIASYIYHSNDNNTYFSFWGSDQIAIATGGVNRIFVNNTGVRIGDTGNAYFQAVSGSYGSIQIDGGAHNGWEGYSIGGRVVFMHDNSSQSGIYNDANNAWLWYGVLNGKSIMYYNGVNKLETTNTGVTVSGDLNSTSDIRYKKNIETIDSALEKVQSLRGVTFDWDNDAFEEKEHTKKPNFTERATGVIAQDVEKVLPEAVRENEDGFKNVAYGNMVGLLVEAIKELKAEIEELKR